MSQFLRTRSPGRWYKLSWNAESDCMLPGKGRETLGVLIAWGLLLACLGLPSPSGEGRPLRVHDSSLFCLLAFHMLLTPPSLLHPHHISLPAGPSCSETFTRRVHFLNSPSLLSQGFLFGDISDGLGNSIVVTSVLLML